MQHAPVEVGEILDSKYRVERVLGVGGMGVVVAAMHLQLDKMVALKFMLEEASLNPEVAGRFAREAKAAARLHTRHIAQILDVGNLENGAPYMVMEYLEGSDLRELMKVRKSAGKGPLPVQKAVDYIVQACLGMAEAHSHGFVHRDLKPPNLFLTRGPDGRPLIKILDFGIAKASIDGIDTSTKAVMGSPTYMSPEQWEGARYVDERGDIWALGAILQFLLSGRPPFHGDSLPVLFRNIASREPRSLAQPELAVPPGLQAVVRRCLAKSSHDRPQTAAELATLLAPYGPIESEEYAKKAQRVSRAGTEGTMLGQGAFPTPIQDLHANGLVNMADEPPPQDPTSVTTLSNAGTLPGVQTMAEQVSARNWLPYIGVALVLVGAVTFGALADEPEEGNNTAASEAAVPEELAQKPDSPEIDESPPTPKPADLDEPPAPETPPAAMTETTLSTRPAGARIWIDGEEKGTSPLKLSLPIGSTVWARIDLDGYDSLEQEIEVSADVPKQSFNLVSLAGESAPDSGETESDNSSNDSTKSRRSRKKGTSRKDGVIKSGKSRREKIRDSADRRH